jgi:hypothetical protein
LPGWQRTGDVIAETFVHDDFRSAIRLATEWPTPPRPQTTILPSSSATTR